MKTTKKAFLGVLMVALALPVLDSCKKGENDPGLSMRGRKGRLAGEWTVDKMDNTSTSTSTGGTSTTVTTVDGTTYKSVYTPAGGGTSSTTDGTVNAYTYTIEKDGTFKSTWDYTTTSTLDIGGTVYTTTVADKTESSGNWSFLSKDKDGDYKNKQRVVMNTTSSTNTQTTSTSPGGTSSTTTTTNTWGNGENPQVWNLDQLKNKEVVADWDYANSWSSSTSGGSSSSSGTDVGSITMSQ